MDYNKNLRIVRTSGHSYPFPYKDNVLWVHHDENNNPVPKIWDHGKWVSFVGGGSGSGDITIDTELNNNSVNPVQNKVIAKELDKKIDKAEDKGLSANDFTDELKAKLDSISDGATKVEVDDDLNENSENPVQNKVVTKSISSISNRVASSDSLGMIKSGLVSDDGYLEIPYIHAVRKSTNNNFYNTINAILNTIHKYFNIEQFYNLVLDSSRTLNSVNSEITYDEIYNSLYNNDSKSLSKLFFLIDDDSNDVNSSLINTTELFIVTSLTDSIFTFTINYLNIADSKKIYPDKCYVEFSFKRSKDNLAYYAICSPQRYVYNIEDGVSYDSNAIPTVDAIKLVLRNKVDIVAGKNLSTNDYTNDDKAKVDAALTEHQKLKTINGESIIGEGDIEIKNESQSITIDSELSDASENPVQNKVITSALAELQDYCFPTSLEATISPSSAEWTGNSVQVSVGYKVLRNSNAVTADAVTIIFNGETKIIEDTGSGSEKFIVTSQGYKSGSVSAKKGTTIIKNSPMGIGFNLYLPVYYGFSKAIGKDDIVITELTKGGASISGTKTLNNDDATKYLWLCVPSSMSIKKVTSSGFDVPFLAPVEASTALGSYSCYRTQDLPGSGDMTIVIS